MLIHFAFRKIKDNIDQQIKYAIEKIFEKRKLLFRKNPEFIPCLNPKYHPKFTGVNIYPIPIQNVKKGPNYVEVEVTNKEKFSDNYFTYLREDIRMICFINISVNKIANSIHVEQYGRLGIVFREGFLHKQGIKEVHYFKENELLYDEKVLKWNLQYAYRPNLNSKELLKKRELEIEILAYRKPIKMFGSFKNIRRLNLYKMDVEDVYNEYKIGYDFQKEREWRLVSFNNDYLNFLETDLSLVFVPNNNIREKLTKYFKINWSNLPEVKVCP